MSNRAIEGGPAQPVYVTNTAPVGGSSLVSQGTPAADTSAWSVRLMADARNAALKSIEITLSATPGTVTVVTVPDTARGFRLYSRTSASRFAIGENPATVATVAANDQVVAAADFAIGGIAKPDAWETRLLEDGASRTLRIMSATASTVVDLETF